MITQQFNKKAFAFDRIQMATEEGEIFLTFKMEELITCDIIGNFIHFSIEEDEELVAEITFISGGREAICVIP